MTKFNKLQQKIVREEFARAVMINKAKTSLNEEQFAFFMTELKDYEDNMIITESNQGELMYERLRDRLKNLMKGAVNKIAPNNLQKIDQLADQLADVDMDLDTAKAVGRTPNEIKALETKRNVLLQQLAKLDPNFAQQAQKAAEEENSAKGGGSEGGGEQKSAEEMAKDPKAKQAADKIDQQAAAAEDKLENPKAKGIWGSILDSYKYAFAANASMWKNVFGFFNKTQAAPPQRQDDMLLQLVMQLMKQMQNQNVAGEPTKTLTPEEAEEDGEEAENLDPETGEDEKEDDKSIAIRKGKDSLQSRLSKLFPDLAKAKGTYYYRKTDKPGDQGRIISKNTSALAAILGDIEAQLKGSGIEINESLRRDLFEAVGGLFMMKSNGLLMERSDLDRFKTNIQVALQNVKAMHDDPKKKRKAIQKFLFRLRNFAEKGDYKSLASRYEDSTATGKLDGLYSGMEDDVKEKAKNYALGYAKRQFTASGKGRFKSSTLDDAKKDAPTKSKEQMAKMVPKIKSGVVNISQIIGPKLKAAGFDLKSREGQKVQQRLLKVLRRYLKKELERIGMANKVKLLAMFSKSQNKKKEKMNENVGILEERYLDFFSDYMLKGIINELSNN